MAETTRFRYVRIIERALALRMCRLSAWRALLRACAELAKVLLLNLFVDNHYFVIKRLSVNMVGVVTKNQGANYAGLLGFCQENMALKWRIDVICRLFGQIQ